MDFISEVCGRGWGSGAGGKRRGLGPRNDVFTTYKAVTLRGGQRIIAVFSRAVNILEVRREQAEEIIKILKKIISCLFVFLSYRICLLVLKLRGKLKRKLQSPATSRARSISRLHRFCWARTSEDYRSSRDADKNYGRKCQIYRK